MKLHSDEFYHAAIKNTFPDSWGVRKPDIPGTVSPVFLCDTLSGTHVCRFSEPELVFHNKVVSDLLTIYEIPVPQTQIHAYLDSWFETYEWCPAPTLYEWIQAGMSDRAIFKTYQHAINTQNKISQIPIDEFKPRTHRYASEVFVTTQKMRVQPALANVYGFVHKAFADRGQMRLLHNDLYEKNILVNCDKKLAGLIDLDSVSLCNESFSVLLTLQEYPLDNYSEFMDYYEDTTGRAIKRRAIMHGLKLLQKIRKAQLKLNQKMWRGYNPPNQR